MMQLSMTRYYSEDQDMRHKSNRSGGFTMIELVTVLLIIGLVGAIGAVGFGDAIRGYVISAESAEQAQEAQVALTKFNVELMRMNAVTASTSTSITYQPIFGFPIDSTTHTFNFANGVVTWEGQPLINDVQDFSITYHDTHDSAAAATFTNGTTSMIQVSITTQNAAGSEQTFTQRIFPLVNHYTR